MVTQAQLTTALQVATKLQDKLSQLVETVRFGVDATVAGVPLDSTVVNALVAQYSTQKTDLSNIFAQLP